MMRGVIRNCPCCGAHLQRGKLMCPPHWMMVPSELRAAINKAWKAFRQSSCGQPAILAYDVYTATYRAAVAGVVEKLNTERAAA